MAASRTAIAPANPSVSRSRIGSLASTLIAKPVPGPPHSLQRRPAERPVDLLAEIPDVDVDDVRIAVEREVPDVLDETRA